MWETHRYEIRAGWENDQLIGMLNFENIDGKEVYSFEYEPDWITSHPGLVLDPALQPFPGRQYAEPGMLFRFLEDASPDRWGQTLIRRRRQQLAAEQGELASAPERIVFLTGIDDRLRMGGIRVFQDGHPLSESPYQIPPFANLRALEQSAREFEKASDALKETNMAELVDSGSSLGGARPKVNVVDSQGELWIAKFPSTHDASLHTERWEMVVHDLAALCGIRVPEAQLKTLEGVGTFVVKRFDRDGTKRIHFVSAMTLLGKHDGESASFLDIADAISSYGAAPAEDLQELWKRIAFSVAVNNTDCHLRNHGFLLEEDGWHLSPAYDMNPTPFRKNMALTLDGADDAPDMGTVIATADYYGIENPRAEAEQISKTVQTSYGKLAAKYGIPDGEIRRMSAVFERNLTK